MTPEAFGHAINDTGDVVNPRNCKFCGLKADFESKSHGCSIKGVTINEEFRPRIPYTPPYYGENYENCHDCGATEGRYHHPGCDMETCIGCLNQLISCACEANIQGKPFKIPPDVLLGVMLRTDKTVCTICGKKPVSKIYPLTNDKDEIVEEFWTCEQHTGIPEIEKDLRKGVKTSTIVKKWNR